MFTKRLSSDWVIFTVQFNFFLRHFDRFCICYGFGGFIPKPGGITYESVYWSGSVPCGGRTYSISSLAFKRLALGCAIKVWAEGFFYGDFL